MVQATGAPAADPTPAAEVDVVDVVDPAVWRTVWTVLVGGLAVLFDTTIVAVALHTLATELDSSVATIQWVTTGYLLAMAVTIPIAGWAQRVLGGKRLWMMGLAVFLAGSVLSSLAWNPASLIGVSRGAGCRRRRAGAVDVDAGHAGSRRPEHRSHHGRHQPARGARSDPRAGARRAHPAAPALVLDVLGQRAVLCGWAGARRRSCCPRTGRCAARRWTWSAWGCWRPGSPACCTDCPTSASHGGFGRADVFVPLVAGLMLLGGFVGWALRRREPGPDRRAAAATPWPLASSSAAAVPVRAPRCTARCCCCRCTSRACAARTCWRPACCSSRRASALCSAGPGRPAHRHDRPALGGVRRVRRSSRSATVPFALAGTDAPMSLMASRCSSAASVSAP